MPDRQILLPFRRYSDGLVPGSHGFSAYIPTGQEASGRALTFRCGAAASAAVANRARVLAFSGAGGSGEASGVWMLIVRYPRVIRAGLR